MGIQNYLMEGISCTGETLACRLLERRRYYALNGVNARAYCGDPATGKPLSDGGHDTHIWDVAKVKRLVENQGQQAVFFCGSSRNFDKFIHLFDKVLCSKLLFKRSIIT